MEVAPTLITCSDADLASDSFELKTNTRTASLASDLAISSFADVEEN
jgi:hypothetical protein